jgi:hypothetical protein
MRLASAALLLFLLLSSGRFLLYVSDRGREIETGGMR